MNAETLFGLRGAIILALAFTVSSCASRGYNAWDWHQVQIGQYTVVFEVPGYQSRHGPGQENPLESIPLGDYDPRTDFQMVFSSFWDFQTSPFKPVDGTVDLDIALVGLTKTVPYSPDLAGIAEQYYDDLLASVRAENLQRARQDKMLASDPIQVEYELFVQNGCLSLRFSHKDYTRILIPLTDRHLLLARSSIHFGPTNNRLEPKAREMRERILRSITVIADSQYCSLPVDNTT